MRTKLYFVITLLAFFALTALPNSFAQGPLAQPSVRLVYFLPSDRPARPDRIEALRPLIKEAQEFYADEMERHGYGRKTFRVETDKDETPVVHRVNGKFNENYYYTGVSDFKIWEEVYEHFDELEHIYFVAIDLSYEALNDGDSCGLGGIGFLPMGGDANFSVGKIAIRHRSETSGEEGLGGSAIIPASGPCFFDDGSDHNHPLRATTHELGHAFGLEHDFRSGKGWDNNKTVMGGSAFHLSSCAAEWLSVNRFFNTKLTPRNKSGEIQLLSIRTYNKDTISLRFKVVDPDGLHQTQLLIPHILNGTGWGPYRLFDCKRLNGKTSTIESFVRAAEIVDRVTLQIVDVNGNVTWATFPIHLDEVVPTRNFLDVNSDGLVNLSDLTLIASHYGRPGKSPTDVNEDGIVNIVDMLLVAGKLSALPRQVVETFAAADVQQWLTDAKQLGIENELLKKGVIILEHLLAEINLPSKSTEVAIGPLRTVFEGHTKVVWSVAFSPDGQTLASASWDKTIRLWNLHTQQLETTLIGHTADTMSVTFSPDGETLASAGWDQTILFWNVRTGELIGGIQAHSGGIESVLFSPDGETLASASADRTIRLWNVRTRKLERTLTWTARIRSIAFSPNGGMLASSSADTTVHLWNPRTGKHIRTLRGHTDWVNKVMFSPDGQMLVSSSSDGTVRLWNPANGKPKRTLTNQHGWTKPLAFSSDSEKLLIGGGNRISVWNTQTGQYEAPLAEGINDTTSLVLSPDGQIVATGSDDNKVRLWEFRRDGEAAKPSQLKGDVNDDGIINVQDLVLVASNLGQSAPNDADINKDGIVNIMDLVLVAGVLGDTAAAPTIYAASTELFTAQEVQQWLIEAKLSGENSPVYRRGILMLEQLLMALIPKETTLLPNYPNPFNPETWIPYQLAKPADVTLHIYTTNGTLIRTLALGYQSAGMYHNKSRAAYWDGKNEAGEPVASSVYFYTLTAGDFTATRKMIVVK